MKSPVSAQPGVLAPCPVAAHYVTLRVAPGREAELREALSTVQIDEHRVVGLGASLLASWGLPRAGHRGFPTLTAGAVPVPSTQADVWVYTRGADPGEVFDRVRAVLTAVGDAATPEEDVNAWSYRGRDLSGYEDGTENPTGEDAEAAAFVDGWTFVAAQRWIHDLRGFSRLSADARDHTIGRRLADNEEIDDAPDTAHVKRTAQESYEPPAFLVRRSLPWGGAREHGLYFVAFGADLDRYERILRRMCGYDDGVIDGLFRFSRPVSGGYYACPPVAAGRLVLG